MFAARQFVNHGHVLINGKRVNIPSYQVSEGDVISVRETSKQIPMVIAASTKPERDVPTISPLIRISWKAHLFASQPSPKFRIQW